LEYIEPGNGHGRVSPYLPHQRIPSIAARKTLIVCVPEYFEFLMEES
jgi:hypothetical protein